MIKLIITSDNATAVTRRFDQSSIIIGGEHALHADLKLSGQSLHDRHIQITQQIENNKKKFFITNLANDPFVTLNNLPFGKQPVYGNDLIQVGDISIRFEYEAEQPEDLSDSKKSIQNPLDEELSSRHVENLENMDLKKRKVPPSESMFTSMLGKGSSESYPFTQNISLPTFEKLNPTIGSSSSTSNPKLSLKDYYLSEYDDDETVTEMPRASLSKNIFTPQLAKSWRSFLTIFASFLGAMVLAGSLVYLWVSDQTEEEEMKAARGVADIAMSLTYAQLKHIQPQNQNWSYPEFIKNNLTAILAPKYISMAEVDGHGQFANCPYMLRIYTSNDLSQFLVIAQPAPSLLQWLIPKASIVVDSRVMEMRKINDLKALNRLIVNSNNLDGSTNEISNLVKQGELIPLASLISKAENQGLAPPKALGLMRPGAENFIYNAPRYYLLGENILNTSMELVEKFAGMKEVNMLQQELASLQKFPDFVLYSSSGIQQALQAQRALTTLVPKDKFLIAYLQLNAHGKIANTHLLMDDNSSDVALVDKSKGILNDAIERSITTPNFAPDSTYPLYPESSSDAPLQYNGSYDIDTEDPLFMQLKAISSFRQSILKPVSDEIIDLLRKHTLMAQPDFDQHFAKLQQRYIETDREQQTKIFKKFIAITHENAYLPAAKFLEFIQASDLKVLFQKYLSSLRQQYPDHQISDEQVEKQLKQIQESKTWQDLELYVSQASQLLQFDRMSDEVRLVAFQNTTRSIVTQKLNQFILSSTEALPADAFAPDYLQTLTNILKSVWITDPDTHDFYIAEFELREQG